MNQFDLAYSRSPNRLGNVMWRSSYATSRSVDRKDIAIELQSEIIEVAEKDRLNTYAVNSKILEFNVPGKPEIELPIYDTVICDFIVDTTDKSYINDYNIYNIASDEYQESLEILVNDNDPVGLPLVFLVLDKNEINRYPEERTYTYSISESYYAKAIADIVKAYGTYKMSVSSSLSISRLLKPSKVLVSDDIAYSRHAIEEIKPFIPDSLFPTFVIDVREKSLEYTYIYKGRELWITVNAVNEVIISDNSYTGEALIFNVNTPTGIDAVPSPTKAISNVERLKFVVQKQSFIQIYIKFTSSKVTQVIGLPDGMVLEGDYIKGTPLMSGIFDLQLFADTNLIMECILEVPNVQREL